jgi:hypothetical protein
LARNSASRCTISSLGGGDSADESSIIAAFTPVGGKTRRKILPGAITGLRPIGPLLRIGARNHSDRGGSLSPFALVVLTRAAVRHCCWRVCRLGAFNLNHLPKIA